MYLIPSNKVGRYLPLSRQEARKKELFRKVTLAVRKPRKYLRSHEGTEETQDSFALVAVLLSYCSCENKNKDRMF